jgi:hypothetical protein
MGPLDVLEHFKNLLSQIVCGRKNNAAHTILSTPSLSVQLLYNLKRERECDKVSHKES